MHSLVLHNIDTSLNAEGLALKYGMLMAKEMRKEKVIFEVDSSRVAKAIRYGTTSTQDSSASWRHFCTENLSLHSE